GYGHEEIRVPCPWRGVRTIASVVVMTDRPLGLFRLRRRYPVNAEVITWPPPRRQTEGMTGAPIPDPTAPADEFVGHRRYQPGDPPRRIDWKAAARDAGLMVKSFAPADIAPTELDFDELTGLSTEARLEHLAWAVERAVAAGEPFAIRVGTFYLPVGEGPAQRRRALDTLARYGGTW
ncbi:MAG: DUF58 domain-containing protein, partial [Phycisphaeraceae bacterium]|nr:DUF58 domain-containing protein [Phycisphaeraceae bacterium]